MILNAYVAVALGWIPSVTFPIPSVPHTTANRHRVNPGALMTVDQHIAAP